MIQKESIVYIHEDGTHDIENAEYIWKWEEDNKIMARARTRINKKTVEEFLSAVDNGMWRIADLFTMGPIRIAGGGFRIVARRCGATINYYLVACTC
jgi:predicted GNAT family N-acyltransferase